MEANDKHIRPLIAALIVAIAPHITRLPLWVIIWCVGLWGYLVSAVRNKWPKPGKTTFRILTAVGILSVFLFSGRVLGGDFYISLLAVMAGLKPLEAENHRDKMVTVFLGYFLVITSLFTYESLLMTVYMFFSVLVTTAVLIHINHSGGHLKENIRLSAKMMLQAAPLMLALFFLFPRVQGNLWGFTKQRIGRTGFSESISPGGITSLVQNNDIAFRAIFKNRSPARRDQYWRGIVLDNFDGRTWRRGRRNPIYLRTPDDNRNIEYEIILEPTNRRWMFALDVPVDIYGNGRILNDLTIVSRRPLEDKTRYTVKSITHLNTQKIQRWRNNELMLPESNRKAKELGRKWAEESESPEQVVNKALEFFNNNNFIYSLNPMPLGRNPVDEFLFLHVKASVNIMLLRLLC